MNDERDLIAQRLPLPCQVPQDGRAVVLADGRVAPQGVQGPGRLDPKDWEEHGRHLEALLFPATSLRLRFDVADLHTAEGIGLGLTVTLALRIEEPVRFLVDVVRDDVQFTSADLGARLRDAIHTGLAQELRLRPLARLESHPNLRGWLGTTIEGYLTAEADLLGRSGLAVIGVEAFDLRCQIWDEQRQAAEPHYLRAALTQVAAEGRRLLDQAVLAELQQHLPVKEELVERKERLADLSEREATADIRLGEARRTQQVQVQDWAAAQRSRPSALRPELWRRDLGERVDTAPLSDGKRVYIVTRNGRALAFDGKSGEPAWSQPAELGISPGSGLALAASRLWVPGHDGVLYGLDPDSGALACRVDVGGRLSAAPLPTERRLYLSVDVDARTFRPGAGQVVAVDPQLGRVEQRWQVSQRGLRARPALWEQTLYVGDRGGGFYAVDLWRDTVEALPVRGGRILAAPLIDPQQKHVIVADNYGHLLALDRAGRELWRVRLGGPVVGRPILHRGLLYAGAGDGQVYTLSPADGQPVREPFRTHGAVAAPLVAWRDLLFVSSNDGYLYALETGSGQPFWKYPSGSPVSVPVAATEQGRVYVVDSEGHLNAVRWCLSHYAEGARRAQRADPPRWREVVDLWLAAGETQAALEAAERMGRPDLVAQLAMSLNWYEHAAQNYEAMARQSRDLLQAAAHWAEAARAWELEGRTDHADRCRLLDANNRQAPLLTLQEANLPLLTLGQRDFVQVRVTNCTDQLARDVVLAYEGQVQRAGERRLGSLGPHGERQAEIEVVPTESGSATLNMKVHYADQKGRPQRPVLLEVRLKVARPPEVHKHFHGPVVDGDGVIIMRGGAGAGGGRRIQVQSGGDKIEIARPTARSGRMAPPAARTDALDEPATRTCPACGESLEATHRFCSRCGTAID